MNNKKPSKKVLSLLAKISGVELPSQRNSSAEDILALIGGREPGAEEEASEEDYMHYEKAVGDRRSSVDYDIMRLHPNMLYRYICENNR